jgi:hypothetical protein
MRARSATVVFSVLLGMAGAVVATSPATAARTPTSLKGWLLAEGEAQKFAKAYGKPVPVQWVTCADYPKDNPSSCGSKISIHKKYFVDPIRETDYFTLVKEINHKHIKSGESVLADYETWVQTPRKQRAHPEKYICMTDQLAAKHHLFLVQSPFNPSTTVRREEEVKAASCAAKYGTNEVTELQYQGREQNAAAYRKYISEAVSAIHAVAKHARIMGGLATDLDHNGVPVGVPICDIIHSYFATKKMLIGYWLNSSTHTAVALKFFEDIGAIAGTTTKC